MSRVSSVSRSLHLQLAPCALSELVDEALSQSGLALGADLARQAARRERRARVSVELHGPARSSWTARR